jgi:hypothetical protein
MKRLYLIGDACAAAKLNLRNQLESGERYAKNINRPLTESWDQPFELKHFLR